MLSQYGSPCTGCPVLGRPRGDFRGDRPEGRRPARADRLERRPAIPHLRHVPAHHLRRVRGGTEAAPPDGGKRGPRTALMTHSATDRNAPRLARTLSEKPSVVEFRIRPTG